MGSSSRTSDAHPPSARDSSALATLAQAADSVFELDPLSTLESVERHDSFDAGSLGDFLGTSASRRVSAHVGGASNMSTFDASLPDSLLQLLYPGWSSDLPNPTLVKSLCVLYFEADSCARGTSSGLFARLRIQLDCLAGLINRSKFMTSLSLPPSHPRFPSTALLHAICGIACLYMTATSDPLGVWNEGFWTIEATPSDYFLKLAKLHIDEATVKCTKLFEAAQAAILVCFSSYAKARFIEGEFQYSLPSVYDEQQGRSLALYRARNTYRDTARSQPSRGRLRESQCDKERVGERQSRDVGTAGR